MNEDLPSAGNTLLSSAGAMAQANVVVIGAGWWSQGWHLPHLHRNERARISAIVGERAGVIVLPTTLLSSTLTLTLSTADSSPHPKSNLNPDLESLQSLAKKCEFFNYACMQALPH